MSGKDYTPPLGTGDTGDYDRAIRRWTREMRWRGALLALLDPQPGERVVDVGCGTGSFAVMLKSACPETTVLGVDPDREALSIAEEKAREAGVEVAWRQGFARDLEPGGADVVVSSLMFHQVPLAEKRAGLGSMHGALRPGGRLLVADYARQGGLMRLLFRCTIQRLDGIEDTQPNVDGVLPGLIADAGFVSVREAERIHTVTGTIALIAAERPG